MKEFNVTATLNIDVDIEANSEEEAIDIVFWNLIRDHAEKTVFTAVEIIYDDEE